MLQSKDNRKDNLRVVTNAENCQNRSGVDGCRKYGAHIRGTSWNKRVGKWSAQCGLRGKINHLGYFKSQEEAGEVAKAYRLKNMTHNVERA